MQPKRPTSMSTFAMLVTLGVSSPFILAEFQFAPVQAQTSPAPTTIRIDNLTRMAPINQALKKQYETQFSDTTIEIKPQQADSNLQPLQNKQADLAAISRLLTDEEKAQGLVQVPVTREKIAIVVGKDNAFAAGLTIDQVVKIFRGEITDWSQLGGKPGPIRVIHRPIANNLQGTLQTYELFRQATFEAGGNTVQLDQDSLTALAAELGSDGISYALASQMLDAKGVRPVSMYNTLPDDPRYPFSQPFTYVYQGKPSPSTQTFLDYVASDQGQQAIAEAKTQPDLFSNIDANSSSSTPSGDPTADNNPSETTENPSSATSNSNTSDPDSSADPSDQTQEGSNGLGWLPIGLMVLVLGGVVGGILKTMLSKRQPKTPPRPAPNYAEKIRPTTIQGSSTQLQKSPESSSSPSPPIAAENSSLSPENMVLGATAGAAAAGVAETLASPDTSEAEPQSSEWVDITSKELQAQTRIQNPKTELQDTPPSARNPKTQLQDAAATQLQSFETVDDSDSEVADAGTTQLQDPSPTQVQDPSATKLQDPSQTQLQDPKQTWAQDEAFPQSSDASATKLQDPSATQLQDPSPTQLQDSSPTQLQDPSPTQLQDPKQTWTQDEAFPQNLDPSPTQLQDSSPTQLQDPSPTQLQDPSPTQLQDSSPTQLQDSSPTQLQDPKETWSQDEAFPEDMDDSQTQLQDPSQTQLQDPKQTWIQDE